jgi:hypothetical protein
MNRVEFFESISGIQYPQMLVNFFDHFLALKQIVENSGKVSVPQQYNDGKISFNIEFSDKQAKETALNLINNCTSMVMIYERPIYINIKGLPVDDSNLNIELY